ncbi:uncharacterized protein LOC132268407 isoform X2 [Cornus florida]|uniref:uncharacterized protein LOC132268407 isoform X2 n=1 Tax=Cornus florida TaxID=4283 RepID=UPI00289A800C|nr:uncharacterized protein LOC132268407 isoform X2 [Cornus florida]
MVQFEWPEDLELDMRLMAVKMDPPKLESVPEAESVDCFLQSLGLNKYSVLFKDKKIDKATLVCMTDEQLKAFGLRMGPRRKILSASKIEV